VRGRAAALAEGRGGRHKSGDREDRLEQRIDGGGVESGGDLGCFGMKSETTRDGLLFIGSKILAVVLNRSAANSFEIRPEAVLV
jgi:hypothetical protein